MIVFFTRSTQHLASSILLPQETYTIKQFSDGELYLSINSKQALNDEIWIICTSIPPAENIMELFFLLNALSRNRARSINIFFSYFAYARQIAIKPGEAGGAELICSILKQFHLKHIMIMHAHAPHNLEKLLPFTNCIDWNFFCTAAKEYDIIAAPDEGAAEFTRIVSAQCGKPAIFLHKSRPSHEQVHIDAINETIQSKKILLIDDMITTGRTLCAAAGILMKHGAQSIGAAATHGIFSDGAIERLQKSPIKNIVVTNSLDQNNHAMIQSYNIGPFITSIIESYSN